MKRLIAITIITILTFLGGLYILTHLDKYHDEIATPSTNDFAQASVNASKCMIDSGYKIDSIHGKIVQYKNVPMEIVLVNDIPCGSAGYVSKNKIVLKKLTDNDGLHPNIVAHEAYHWCKKNGFENATSSQQYDEEVMAYCVGQVVDIIYSNTI